MWVVTSPRGSLAPSPVTTSSPTTLNSCVPPLTRALMRIALESSREMVTVRTRQWIEAAA